MITYFAHIIVARGNVVSNIKTHTNISKLFFSSDSLFYQTHKNEGKKLCPSNLFDQNSPEALLKSSTVWIR